MKKGFTLIELLVVIAVLAVLAAGVFVAIDPVDKIKAANDAKVQNDIGQIAQAYEAYAVSNLGVYPANPDPTLKNSGDLKTVPTAPATYTYSYGAGGTSQYACGTLQSKKYTATPFWVWCSLTGKAGATGACTTCP